MSTDYKVHPNQTAALLLPENDHIDDIYKSVETKKEPPSKPKYEYASDGKFIKFKSDLFKTYYGSEVVSTTGLQ